MKKLTKVDETYIRAQKDKISPQEIAADLKKPLVLVQRFIESLIPEVVPNNVLKRLTDNPGKAAVMTADQAMSDDSTLGASPFESMPVAEAQREYIKTHQGDKSLENLSKETGLPPFVVQQVLRAINAPQAGREEYFNRNKNTLHKIRPNEGIS